MNDTEKEAALTDLNGRLLAAGAPNIGPILQAIIAAILAAFKGGACPAPVATARNHPFVFRVRTRRQLVQQGVPWEHLPASVDAVVTVTTSATDEDVARCAACAE